MGEPYVKLWYFAAFKLLIFSSHLCPLFENVSLVVGTFFLFLFSLVFPSSSLNSSSASTKREAIVAENLDRQEILAIISLLSNLKQSVSSNHQMRPHDYEKMPSVSANQHTEIIFAPYVINKEIVRHANTR